MMTETTTHNRPLIEQNLEYFGNEIQRLMSDYPCLREICKGLETAAYPAALFTGACFLGTLMTRCTYRFYHRRLYHWRPRFRQILRYPSLQPAGRPYHPRIKSRHECDEPLQAQIQ